MKRFLTVLLLAASVGSSVAATQAPERDLTADVRQAERAFAKTMADRDFTAFGTHVSAEAIFFGRKGAMRGRDAVLTAWKRFFEGKDAPFSWDPETVEVLDSGTHALTSGPVRDPSGELIGTFTSIWRLEPDGRWRVLFDKGCEVCAPEKKP